MSYMLGRHYIWVDATHVHIWSAEGYDGWDESSWVQGFEAPSDRRSAAFGRPSGVSVRQKVADEYVVMRMAELVAKGELSAAMERALANHSGNKGCEALVKHAPALRAALGQLAVVVVLLAAGSLATGCRPASSRGADPNEVAAPRPTVIGATEGERRFLRGGIAPLLIKIDPVTTGSRRMVLTSSDLPPGDAIGVHRHLREDEIILLTRGTARLQLGTRQVTAGAGATVFIPESTCIAVANAGGDTLTMVFIFSSPGFERVLRELSSPEGAPPKSISPAQRAAAFQRGHAVAGPSDC